MGVSQLLSFKGGVHPPESKKHTEHKSIETALVPQIVTIPLQQHIGAPCEPLVKPGDKVYMGQKIGESKGFVGAPVHSSVSGIVKAILSFPHPVSGQGMAIQIENDGKDELDPDLEPKDINALSPAQIKDIIKESGIVGMGGAAFPTHVKLSPPPDKSIDTVILNGAECEPYLTADHRLMIEQPEEIIYGLKAIMKVLGVNKGYIGIENNKPDALETISNAAASDKNIKVMALRTKYPQGAEKQLIYALTGREVPSAGLPMDVGVVVNNVGTAHAIAKAVQQGMPLIERVLTVSGGAVREPKNLLVRIGTSFKEVLDQCGGLLGEPEKVISGGPMMGIAQYTLDVPVIKGTSGILVFNRQEAKLPEPMPCIRCGRCVEACPIHLMPLFLSAYSLKGNFEECERAHALDCIECGSCSYICPAKRPLVESIRVAKRNIMLERKKKTTK